MADLDGLQEALGLEVVEGKLVANPQIRFVRKSPSILVVLSSGLEQNMHQTEQSEQTAVQDAGWLE